MSSADNSDLQAPSLDGTGPLDVSSIPSQPRRVSKPASVRVSRPAVPGAGPAAAAAAGQPSPVFRQVAAAPPAGADANAKLMAQAKPIPAAPSGPPAPVPSGPPAPVPGAPAAASGPSLTTLSRPLAMKPEDVDMTSHTGNKKGSLVPEKPVVPASVAQNISLQEMLVSLVQLGGSDLHVCAGRPSKLRLHGRLRDMKVGGKPLELTGQQTEKLLLGILNADQTKRLEETHELDLAYELPGVSDARFRVNVFYAEGDLQAAFRLIPTNIKSMEELSLPPVLRTLCYKRQGLVLVCGPTGSGKSTTLAAMIDEINSQKETHILTIEDPIEYIHTQKKALVTQRELGSDTYSFHNALKSALRQDPDVILVGEMRDPETIALGIEAAETGHLVFATLHTQDAAQSMDRIIQAFPAAQQGNIRIQLSMAIEGVIVQTLVPTVSGEGRIAATEIMLGTSAIRALIRENKNSQIYSTLLTGAAAGMRTLDYSLAELMAKGVISRQVAEELAVNKEELMNLVQTYTRTMQQEMQAKQMGIDPARLAAMNKRK